MDKSNAESHARDRALPVAAGFDPQTFEPILTAGNRVMEAWFAIGSELFEFGKSRLDRTFEASKAIVRCGSVDEAMEKQADYARTLMHDYAAEATKLADLGLKAWQAAPRSLGEHVQTAA
jgi:hypothetical protein